MPASGSTSTSPLHAYSREGSRLHHLHPPSLSPPEKASWSEVTSRVCPSWFLRPWFLRRTRSVVCVEEHGTCNISRGLEHVRAEALGRAETWAFSLFRRKRQSDEKIEKPRAGPRRHSAVFLRYCDKCDECVKGRYWCVCTVQCGTPH